jgi:hypothetical protein
MKPENKPFGGAGSRIIKLDLIRKGRGHEIQ